MRTVINLSIQSDLINALRDLRDMHGKRGISEAIQMLLDYWEENAWRRADDAALAQPNQVGAVATQAPVVDERPIV